MPELAAFEQYCNATQPDPIRQSSPYSLDLAGTTEAILGSSNDSGREQALNDWLSRFQPCLFGRHSAKRGLISYCFVLPEDLQAGDEAVHKKVQEARLRWKQLAKTGGRSGFVILVADPRLAKCAPDSALMSVALRLTQLYLNIDPTPDQIFHEYLDLVVPGSPPVRYRWKAGVNVFATAADGRWWHDHRIPGGLALSVNSVGHMVRSAQVAGALESLNAAVEGTSAPTVQAGKFDSRATALELAMKTIRNAATTVSGKATLLIPTSEGRGAVCPFKLPDDLAGFSAGDYKGYYHTDHTVPSSYFRLDVERPRDLPLLDLDFTYLFRKSADNPDFETMGFGERIEAQGAADKPLNEKRGRWEARSEGISGSDA